MWKISNFHTAAQRHHWPTDKDSTLWEHGTKKECLQVFVCLFVCVCVSKKEREIGRDTAHFSQGDGGGDQTLRTLSTISKRDVIIN